MKAPSRDKALVFESYAKVQAMKANDPDLMVIASHDTTASKKLGSQTPDRATVAT